MIARALRQALALVALALIPALVCAAVQVQWRHEEPPAADEVSVRTARAWGAEALFVDARGRARFDAGHIPGAVLLNEDEWEPLVPAFLDAWNPDQRVVVYCDGGGCEASRHVAERIRRELAIKNVYVLKGGWPAWERE